MKNESYTIENCKAYFKNLLLKNKECIPGIFKLTRKEQEVLILRMAGYKNSETGKELGIAEKTVKFHYSTLCKTIGKESFPGDESGRYVGVLLLFIHLFHYAYFNKCKSEQAKRRLI